MPPRFHYAQRVRLDAIRVVEACYLPAQSDAAWIAGILEAVALLDHGVVAYAKSYDPRAPPERRIAVIGGHGELPDVAEVAKVEAGMTPEVLHALHWPFPPVDLLSRRVRSVGRQAAPLLEGLRRVGVGDVAGTFGGEPDGHGVLVGLVVPARKGLPARTVHSLTAVSAHLTSARRLREAAVGALPRPDDATTEAVLDASGRVLHATGTARPSGARDRISHAVRRIEWARGRARRTSQQEALAAWRGLVDGRWSVVDHVESDGRRFLLARRNDPSVRDPRSLGVQERNVLAYAAMGHSTKYIAYLLGLATSTVASHLASARAKLGLRSRREIIEVFGQRETPARPAARRPSEVLA